MNHVFSSDREKFGWFLYFTAVVVVGVCSCIWLFTVKSVKKRAAWLAESCTAVQPAFVLRIISCRCFDRQRVSVWMCLLFSLTCVCLCVNDVSGFLTGMRVSVCEGACGTDLCVSSVCVNVVLINCVCPLRVCKCVCCFDWLAGACVWMYLVVLTDLCVCKCICCFDWVEGGCVWKCLLFRLIAYLCAKTFPMCERVFVQTYCLSLC